MPQVGPLSFQILQRRHDAEGLLNGVDTGRGASAAQAWTLM